jgi:acyl carrier protein
VTNVEQEVRAFITDNYLMAAESIEIASGESLTQRGIVDSVGILELILHLEARYEIEIPDEEVVPENMDTVDNIVRYLERKLTVAGDVETERDLHGYLT